MIKSTENMCGYYVDQHLKEIEPIFQMWCKCFVDFSDISKTVPHQSKVEETNVGIFAGAAWKSNWVAFQEMTRLKEDLKGYGYCDLWIKSDYFNSSEYYIECKGGLVEHENGASNILERAITDMKRLNTEDEKGIKIALAFCNIQFHKKTQYEIDQENTIRELVDNIITISSDFYAYCFPHSVRNYYEEAGEGYYYPGVLILGKVVN